MDHIFSPHIEKWWSGLVRSIRTWLHQTVGPSLLYSLISGILPLPPPAIEAVAFTSKFYVVFIIQYCILVILPLLAFSIFEREILANILLLASSFWSYTKYSHIQNNLIFADITCLPISLVFRTTESSKPPRNVYLSSFIRISSFWVSHIWVISAFYHDSLVKGLFFGLPAALIFWSIVYHFVTTSLGPVVQIDLYILWGHISYWFFHMEILYGS